MSELSKPTRQRAVWLWHYCQHTVTRTLENFQEARADALNDQNKSVKSTAKIEFLRSTLEERTPNADLSWDCMVQRCRGWMDLGTHIWHPPHILLQGRTTSQRRESLGSRSSNALPNLWLLLVICVQCTFCPGWLQKMHERNHDLQEN